MNAQVEIPAFGGIQTRFEQRFGMENHDFYQDYQTGKMGDDMDYMKWAGEYETLLQLQEDYAELQEIQDTEQAIAQSHIVTDAQLVTDKRSLSSVTELCAHCFL